MRLVSFFSLHSSLEIFLYDFFFFIFRFKIIFFLVYFHNCTEAGAAAEIAVVVENMNEPKKKNGVLPKKIISITEKRRRVTKVALIVSFGVVVVVIAWRRVTKMQTNKSAHCNALWLRTATSATSKAQIE